MTRRSFLLSFAALVASTPLRQQTRWFTTFSPRATLTLHGSNVVISNAGGSR